MPGMELPQQAPAGEYIAQGRSAAGELSGRWREERCKPSASQYHIVGLQPAWTSGSIQLDGNALRSFGAEPADRKAADDLHSDLCQVILQPIQQTQRGNCRRESRKFADGAADLLFETNQVGVIRLHAQNSGRISSSACSRAGRSALTTPVRNAGSRSI